MESTAEEILRDIFLRLPTRDVVRGRNVSRQWRGLLTDPSFVDLHAHANHVTPGTDGAATEAVAVSETRGRGIGLEMVVLNLASANPMCMVSDLAAPYSPVNACNGFLLLAPRSSTEGGWPVFVCNPISGAGENLKVRAPPYDDQYRHMYAMGFSPFSSQYKLFCFSFMEPDDDLWASEERDSDLDVLTLGDGNGNAWHQHPDVFPCPVGDSLSPSPPLSVDGKLYVVAIEPYLMLEIDVATEEHRTYPLPPEDHPKEVYPFEMSGRLCVAVRGLGDQQLYFWFMRPVPMQSKLLTDGNDDPLNNWELRYTFYVDNGDCDELRGVWHDDSNGMLCYWLGDDLYKYDTSKKGQQLTADSVLEWDHRIPLPATMAPSESCWEEIDDYKHRWNVYGGYRPSLLSPRLAFSTTLSPQQDGNGRGHLDHALLRALRCQQQTQQQLLHQEDAPANKI
ncbi:hypothetical protein CFC21_085696 [Triticum aestivum]|uniref:F-box domain-containing protein n=2 Tax=Triticum aestivum TaxID=4565 RepID=A0A9R1L8P5_WHEAT|nr:hypothetical protein CFC21_085696 [Triticum aestivum]